MGRIAYQEMASVWPQSNAPHAAPMNAIPKVAFSKTLSDADTTWPVTTVARGDLATVRAETGPDAIIWGGGRLAGALEAADLIDEYRRLVQLSRSRRLEIVEARPFPSGIVLHVYQSDHS